MGTTATSGLYSDPATWVGGVLPTATNAHTISKPGTATTRLTTTAGFAVGATSIAVQAGTGTIVAGECVNFLTIVSVDEFGEPVYDPTYYRVTTGVGSGAGTLVITPGLAYEIPAGTAMTLRNRGHVLEFDAGTATIGPDTGNAFIINGTLRFSRSVATDLRVRGSWNHAAGGTIDAGRPGDTITAVNCVIRLNDSAVPANNKYTYSKASGAFFYSAGQVRTRRTTTTAPITSGATSIQVAEAMGWQVGDQLLITLTAQQANANTAASVPYTIASGYTPGALTVPLTAGVTPARGASGAYVVNVSSNVRFVAANTPTPQTQLNFNGSSGTYETQVRDTEINISSSGLATAVSGSFRPGGFDHVLRRSSWWWNGSASQMLTAGSNVLAADLVVWTNNVTVAIETNGAVIRRGLYYSAFIPLSISSSVIYRGDIDGPVFVNALGARAGQFVSVGVGIKNTTFVQMSSDNAGSIESFSCTTPGSVHIGCDFAPIPTSNRSISPSGTINSGRTTYVDCRLTDAEDLITWGGFPGFEYLYQNCFRRGAPSTRIDEVLLNAAYGYGDASTRLRGATSLRFSKRAAGFTDSMTFTRSVAGGATILLLANLRRNATYGAGSMPRITVSIGNASAASSVADTADTWLPVSLSVTNPSSATAEATITLTFDGAVNGQCWFDGVALLPFVKAVRWYGYVFDETNPFRVIDPLLTLTESQAAAVTGVAIDHTAQTITVTAARTATEIYCRAIWDLCLAANISRTRHITSPDGASFVTTYTVIVGSGGSITGRYTDANGTQAAISVTGLQANSRVQIFNVTDNAELVNAVITGTSTGVSLVHTADKTIRVRVAKEGWLPIEQTGVFNAGGVTFLIEQETDTVWQANGVNGVDCTEFTADYPNLQIDANDADGVTSVARVYAWSRWANAVSADGIRLMHNAVQAINSRNYLIDVNVVDARFQNVNASVPLIIVGGNIRRSDGTSVIAPGPGSIQLDPDIVYAASGAAVAADVWGATLETGFSASRLLRTTAAAVAGKTTGGPAGFIARNLSDTADQINGTADESGNRGTAVYGA